MELSKLKLSKHQWYFKYLLILSGDINLHPGPVQYPCSVCAKPVRKRFISCEKHGLWIHKKCNQFEKPRIGSLLICKPCQDKPNNHLDNSWHQFPFADDFFENRGVPSDEQTNIDFGTPNSIDNWKVSNKCGLHLIHLNLNSLLSKIDELRAIAIKSRATVIDPSHEAAINGSKRGSGGITSEAIFLCWKFAIVEPNFVIFFR